MPESTGALEYHERTNHSPERLRERDHRLDFDNKPTPYTVYEDRPQRSLPDPEPPSSPALEAITEPTPDGREPRSGAGGVDAGAESVDLEAVASLCHYAAGITTELEIRGETHEFRAAATTGALYHVDLYLVCGDLGGGADSGGDGAGVDGGTESGDAGDGLEAGVYHYDPRNHALDVLREGDYRAAVGTAAASPAVAAAPLSVVTTSTWWRNAWKYRERTFRHAFWDSGTTLANLLATAHALGHRAEVLTGFADDPVADLLGVDPEREAPLEVVPIGGGGDGNVDSDSESADAPAIDPIDPETAPLSPNEREFPLIHEAWRAGVLEPDAVASWRDGRPDGPIGTREPGDGERVPLEPVDRETASSRPLGNTVRRRGSCREYEREAISFRKLSTVLDRALRGTPMDVRRESDPPLSFVDAYLVVNAVEGLESGAYQVHASGDEGGSDSEVETDSGLELERLRSGEFREEAGHLALDQPLGADAAVCVYFLADLEAVVDALGDRGYRVAQLEAALAAGRLYLATYAHRTLGGTGLTFYDDAVTEFFAPRAEGQAPMFLYTLGRPA